MTNTDFLAVSEVNIPSIAVWWGYGDESELAISTKVVDNLADLPQAIIKHMQKVDSSGESSVDDLGC